MIKRVPWRTLFLRFIYLNLGCLLGAIAVVMFLVPAQVAPSGISGIATLMNHLWDTPIGLVIILGNLPIQVVAFRMLGGWRALAATLYVIVVSSLQIDLLMPYLSPLVSDPLLNTIFGGILDGISLALVYRAGATYGGTSTLARLLQIRYGTPQSATSLYTNIVVVLGAGFVYGWEAALYALLMLFISGVATDYMLEGPAVVRTAMVVTEHPQRVAQVVMTQMNRGVTGWKGTGMYTGQERDVLFITVTRSQEQELRRLVFASDPKAFMVIGQGHTAYGEGFRENR